MKKNVKLIITSLILLQFISMNFVFAIDASSGSTTSLFTSATSSIETSPTILVPDPVSATSSVEANTIAVVVPGPSSIITIQTEADTAPIIDSTATDTNISIPLQTSNDVPLLQDTINTQESSNSDLLVTSEAADTVVSVVVPPVVESEDIVLPETSPNNEPAISETQTTPNENTQNTTPNTSISIESFTPVPVRQFSLTSRSVKTKKITKNVDKDTINESTGLTTSINPIVDKAKGTISLSGSCTSTYFVVLLFKNETDYIDKPSSAIINKAFNCVNGNFSYTIDELPKSLKNGTYYLLIGQQGDIGTWTPISDLTEVVINN